MYYNKTIIGLSLLMIPALQCLGAQLPGSIQGGYNYYPARGYTNPNPVYKVQPGYYTHYPTDRTTLYQQAIVPSSDIQSMKAQVDDAMNATDNTDVSMVTNEKKQRQLFNHEDVIRRLGNSFNEAYRKYIDMLQRNDPMLREQEEAIRKLFMSFKAQYESFMREVRKRL